MGLHVGGLNKTLGGFPSGSVVESLPANAGYTGDVGLIPGSRRSRGNEMATSILAWRNPMD